MKLFFVKFKDGREKTVCVKEKYVSEDITEVVLSEKINYEDVEYIDIAMHEDVIKAGDEGYYLVVAGHAGCKNRDYGIGAFKPRADREDVLVNSFMPVFGISHNGCCRVAIVTGMQYDAAQVIEIKDNEYSIRIRFMIKDVVVYENISIEFHELWKDATYSDMARVYRNYQLNHGYMTLKEKLTPELEYALAAPNIRIRMGWKPVPCLIHEQTIENEPDMHVACTFDDVINLMEGYKTAGIEKAVFCLVGWNVSGHDGRWPQAFPVEERFGGEERLKKLIARAGELGYVVACHTNSTDAYSIANNFDINDVILNSNGERETQDPLWAGGRTYGLCPKRGYELGVETLRGVAKLGFRGMHYIDVITCAIAKQCFDSTHPLNKRQACEWNDKLFNEAAGMFGAVGSEGAYDHSIKNCDYALYVSFRDFADETSGYDLCDRVVPFWQMVYHGIVASNPYTRTVNATASKNKDDLLKIIEFGGIPQMYYYARFVTGTGFSDWIGKGDFGCSNAEEIAYSAECVKKAADIHNELAYLQYEFMENHQEVAPNVFEITYSDSSVVTVDYNKKTYSLRTGDDYDNC